MTPVPPGTSTPPSPGGLEAAIQTVENRLEAMGVALQQRNSEEVERCASELHRALSDALQMSTLAARQQELPPVLRQRLARASSQIAAQREVLARAMAALDRAIDVLIPGPPAEVHASSRDQGNATASARRPQDASLNA